LGILHSSVMSRFVSLLALLATAAWLSHPLRLPSRQKQNDNTPPAHVTCFPNNQNIF
jgi:hypothetical protein